MHMFGIESISWPNSYIGHSFASYVSSQFCLVLHIFFSSSSIPASFTHRIPHVNDRTRQNEFRALIQVKWIINTFSWRVLLAHFGAVVIFDLRTLSSHFAEILNRYSSSFLEIIRKILWIFSQNFSHRFNYEHQITTSNNKRNAMEE